MKKQANTAISKGHWQFSRFLLRLLPAFGGMVLLFYFIGPGYVRFYLPIFANQLELMHPEYEVIYYEMPKLNGINYIRYTIKINKSASSGQDIAERAGSEVRLKGQASSLCVAPVIVLALIMAWPGISAKNRFKSILRSLPLIFVITLLDMPIIFISRIESVYSASIIKNTILDVWGNTMNNGGRQFLALLAFLISVAPAYLELEKKKQPSTKIGRNDPCPCGSGKKFKACCLGRL